MMSENLPELVKGINWQGPKYKQTNKQTQVNKKQKTVEENDKIQDD